MRLFWVILRILVHFSKTHHVHLVDNFWDATVGKVPRRSETLLAMKNAGLLNSIPSRHVILDRKTQHLDICPDSQDTVRNCQLITRTSIVMTAGWIIRFLLLKQQQQIANARMLWWGPLLSSMVGIVAEMIRKQFYYTHTEKKRDRDLKTIPKKMWLDPQ